MKAAIFHEYGPPEVLKYEDVPTPEPREGEIRIKVRGATVNRVLDVALRRGAQMQRKAMLPCIPGVDCAGIVDAVGPGVKRWKLGDRVVAAGRSTWFVRTRLITRARRA
jgi:NADPH:quinone reductase-like Zn-dependent oxidoreductase